MTTSFYLVGTDYLGLTIPRKCVVLETVCWIESEKVLRVQIDNPLRPEPLGESAPIKELLLSFINPDQTLADVGTKTVMVDALIAPSQRESAQRAPVSLGIGSLHQTLENALEHSSLYKAEQQKWLNGTLDEDERKKWLDGLI